MLKEILSISGKPGLQKLISNSSNAIIVESPVSYTHLTLPTNREV